MIHFIFQNFFYIPLYNFMIALLGAFPYFSIGFAIIVLTFVVRIVLFPLSKKAVRTQIEMKVIEPEIEEIKSKYKDNKQEQSVQIMKLYKEKGVNPFSSIFLILLQLPVLIALYYVFLRGGLPKIDYSILYPFISPPDTINMFFFGIDTTQKNIIFAILAGLTQFWQIQVATPIKNTIKKDPGAKRNMGDDLARSMSFQMKFIMPIFMFFIAWSFPVVVSIYLITTNLFSVAQEFYMRGKMSKEKEGKLLA